jgi:AIPR protein
MNKDLFRDHLRDFVTSELKATFDSLTDKQRSTAMARFYADKVLRPLNPGLVPESEEDLNECAIDGADDCGVDFLAKQGNSVTIIQAKYSSGKKSGKKSIEAPDSFVFFSEVLSRLRTGPKAFKMNAKLREALLDIDWESNTFSLHYITLHQPAENSWGRAEQGISALPDLQDLPDRATLDLLDEEKLNIALRDALKHQQEFTEPIRLLCSKNGDEKGWLLFEDQESGRRSYIFRLNGAQIAELYRRYRSRLFTLNIRNYIGDTKTNRSIRKTALSDSDNFFYFNNGICAVASNITPDENDETGRTFLCDRFSIINGAQTVRSLSKAQGEDSAALKCVEVLVRVVQYGPKVTQDEQEFLDNIIRFNNTQNSIKISDFRSNDPIQFSIRRHFADLPALRGRKFSYKNKRSGERESTYISVTMEDFTKAIHAFNFGPDDVFGGTQYLFDTGRDGGYTKLFGDEADVKTGITTEQFEKLAGTWFTCEFIKGLWKKLPDDDRKGALERRWMVFFTVGESFRTVYKHIGIDLDQDIRKLANPQVLESKDSKGEHFRKVVSDHFELAVRTLKKVYDQSKKEASFVHRNWFRDETSLTSIRKELESVSMFTVKMPQDFVLGREK